MELGQHRPRCGELDRVDVRTRRFEKRLQALRREIEPVALPPLPWLVAELRRPGRDALDDVGFGGGDDVAARGGDHEQAAAQRQVVAVERRILRVVEAHDERADPRLHDRSHGFETRGEVGETVSAPDHGLRQSMHAQDRADDDSERAFRPEP